MSLTDIDLARFSELGITRDVLDAAGVRRLTDADARAALSLNGTCGNFEGIAFPYIDPRFDRAVTMRVRLDHPPLNSDGTPNGKYRSAYGDNRHLYFPPGAQSLLTDADVPAMIVESEKAALAITAAAARADRKVLVIATGGCWSWRGRIGKMVDASGARVDEKGPLPDFALVLWHRRPTVILFDARPNSSVQAARRALATDLMTRGADVRHGHLPDDERGVNGPDDLIKVRGDAVLWEIVDQALTENSTPASALSGSSGGVQLGDFHAYMPMHTYIFAPCRELWPAASVNARIPPVPLVDGDGTPVLDDNGKPKRLSASSWLDRYRPVEQMTWAPGLPPVVPDRLVSDGGWIDRPGCSTYNMYRPPQLPLGDPQRADPWLAHVRSVYPDDAEHIISWLAHRVQRPQEKINHALVLGGLQGIGKDTLLEPVKQAIGPWNFAEVSPAHVLGRFNGFVKSVVLRINEARDQGDVDRYAFYDHVKIYTAAPPDVIRVDEKHLREYAVCNVTGVVFTTNHKTGGLYLPSDDRRHYVAWSPVSSGDFAANYWASLYGWYESGGSQHVAAYLMQLDLTAFDPKAPPPKTPAFWDVVDANRAPEDADLADTLDNLHRPPAVTLADVAERAPASLAEWLRDRKCARQMPHRLESVGYVPVRNDDAKDGLWKLSGRRQVIYAQQELSPRDRIIAARNLVHDR